MRLIDADALLYHLADYQLQESPGWGANGYGNADAYEAITNCIKAIEDAPTIEPERKKGKWILSDVQRRDDIESGNYQYFCSNCLYSDIHAKTVTVPFCWHCGTDMGGEEG